MPHAMCVFLFIHETPLGKPRMALSIYICRHCELGIVHQQIQECGGILSVLLQEKKRGDFQGQECLSRRIKLLEKLLSQRMGSITVLYSDIPRLIMQRLSIIRKVLVKKEMFEGRKVRFRHMYVPSSEAKEVRRVRCKGQ